MLFSIHIENGGRPFSHHFFTSEVIPTDPILFALIRTKFLELFRMRFYPRKRIKRFFDLSGMRVPRKNMVLEICIGEKIRLYTLKNEPGMTQFPYMRYFRLLFHLSPNILSQKLHDRFGCITRIAPFHLPLWRFPGSLSRISPCPFHNNESRRIERLVQFMNETRGTKIYTPPLCRMFHVEI